MLLDRFSDTFGTRTVLIVPDTFMDHIHGGFRTRLAGFRGHVHGHVHGHVRDMFEYVISKFVFVFFDAIII